MATWTKTTKNIAISGGGDYQYNQAGLTYNEAGYLYNSSPVTAGWLPQAKNIASWDNVIKN